MIDFPFKKFLSKNLGVVLKPIALVALIHDERTHELEMLIDSGADISLIPKSTGEDLKFKKPEKEEVKFLGGIAGGIPVVYRTLVLKIGKIKFPSKIAWAQTEDVPFVLGRIDVFDNFDIEFKQKDRKVLLKER